MAGKTLSTEAQIYVVSRLAQFARPAEVIAEVKEQFKVAPSVPALLHYNPTTAQGRDLRDDLKSLFYEVRERFRANVDDIPCANAAVRLATIQKVIDRAEARGNDAMVLQANEQAAKESGGAFTNRRELTGKDGKPIESKLDVSLTADFDLKQRAAELAKLPADELLQLYGDALGTVGKD